MGAATGDGVAGTVGVGVWIADPTEPVSVSVAIGVGVTDAGAGVGVDVTVGVGVTDTDVEPANPAALQYGSVELSP